MLNINQFKTELANRLLLIKNILDECDLNEFDASNITQYLAPYTYLIEEGDIDSFFYNINEIDFKKDCFYLNFVIGYDMPDVRIKVKHSWLECKEEDLENLILSDLKKEKIEDKKIYIENLKKKIEECDFSKKMFQEELEKLLKEV